MTRVAVVMPTLARFGWDRHLPAILGQTRPADQIVVVIDRESDSGEREALRQSWPQVDFVFNDARKGITPSLNAGLAAARDAEVIVRADDDDECLPDRIERQLAVMEAERADFVSGWAEATSEQGAGYIIRCPVTQADIIQQLGKRNCLVHAALMFRREPVMKLGGYDETFVNAQDYGLYLAAMRAGLRFAAVAGPVVKRHYGASNISVERRMHQLMYSCAARAAHHAATADRVGFIRAQLKYLLLAATPMWVRRLRRRLFALIGRGR